MTDFEAIKKAFAKVRADLDIYDFATEKTISIPLKDERQLDLYFDAAGNLVDTIEWD